jgi:DNA-binding Lrp family transcriptional regulator
MDDIDRAIVNRLQGGFPVCDRPFASAAQESGVGIDEAELIDRISAMLAAGTLSRFGPLYRIERFGGAFSLAAIAVPDADFDRVAAIVNAFPEVAHNYRREHRYNMWFVLATEAPEGIAALVHAIEDATGYAVLNLPKLDEYCVELRFAV